MASLAVTEKTLEGVRGELTCAICQDLFKIPKTLPCLHTFCEECLKQAEKARKRLRAASDKGNGSVDEVECPSCRGIFVYKGHVAGITTNFVYVNLLEHLDIHERVSSDGALTCGKCKLDVAAPAVAFCYDCKCAVCEPCKQMHQRSVEHSSHNICSLNIIKESNILPPVSRSYRCPNHPDEELKLFCFDCQEVICRDCTIIPTDHGTHYFQFISQIITDQKKIIGKKLQPLQSTLDTVTRCYERLTAHINKITQVLQPQLSK